MSFDLASHAVSGWLAILAAVLTLVPIVVAAVSAAVAAERGDDDSIDRFYRIACTSAVLATAGLALLAAALIVFFSEGGAWKSSVADSVSEVTGADITADDIGELYQRAGLGQARSETVSGEEYTSVDGADRTATLLSEHGVALRGIIVDVDGRDQFVVAVVGAEPEEQVTP